jgi:RimJ/RimL family protein N-acetyltransferase
MKQGYPTTLVTERLTLRPFTAADIHASYEMNLDAEVSKYTGDGGVVSLQEIERRITQHVMGDYEKYGYGRLVVELNDSPGFMGCAGLKYIEEWDEVDLGYRLMKKYWGNGYATEASRALIDFGFKTLHLDKIVAAILPANVASKNVLLKLGFSFENEFEEEGMLAHKYALVANP